MGLGTLKISAGAWSTPIPRGTYVKLLEAFALNPTTVNSTSVSHTLNPKP